MSGTELADLEALILRVLPDPKGFAEKVFQQLLERLATDVPSSDHPNVVAGLVSAGHEALVDRNVLLAAAVGACDCWGEEPECAICGGAGSAGWTQPDSGLYGEFVRPAIARMSDEAQAPSGNHGDKPQEEGQAA
jgi:hypothetical protein